MANKPSTTDVSAGAQYLSSIFNENFAILEDAIEGCLGRGGTSESPNSMEGDLDMDLHKIINVGAPSNDNDAVRLVDLSDSDATGAASAQLRADLGSTAENYGIDLIGNGIKEYSNIAALKAITAAPDTTLAIVKGYYSDGDGGSGKFYWDSTSTDTDNGGTIIKATAVTTGRWKRLYEGGAVNVKWFGAKGDGSTDDTLAIQATIDYASKLVTSTQYPTNTHGIEVHLNEGVFNISDTLEITYSGVSLIGKGQHSTVIQYTPGTLTTADYLISFGVSPSGTSRMYSNRLEGFSLTHDLASDGLNSPRGIYLLDVHSWVIKNVRVFGTHQGLYAQDAWVGRVSDSAFTHNYRSVYFNSQVHNTSIRNVLFGRTLAAYSDTQISAHLAIRNCQAVSIESCDFEFGNFASLDTCVYLYNSCRGINVSNNYFESNDGYAIYIRDEPSSDNAECSGITFKSNYINQTSGKGVYIRHNNTTTGALHNGILIEGNYVYIDSAVEFIEDSGAGVVINSFYRGNYLRQALAEAENPSDWNNYGSIYVDAPINISQDSDDTALTIVEQPNGLDYKAHTYKDVSTSAVTIAAISRPGFHVVIGYKSDATTISFVDIVLSVAFGATTVVGSQTRNTPAGRTYTVSSNSLQLAMASDTYRVATTTLT